MVFTFTRHYYEMQKEKQKFQLWIGELHSKNTRDIRLTKLKVQVASMHR